MVSQMVITRAAANQLRVLARLGLPYKASHFPYSGLEILSFIQFLMRCAVDGSSKDSWGPNNLPKKYLGDLHDNLKSAVSFIMCS